MQPQSSFKLHTGSEMPVLGFGTWQLTSDTTGSTLDALERGYRMIDTSGDYGTEPGVGEAIRRSHVPRDDIFLVTKVEEHEDAYQSTVQGLEDLDLDYADLMLIHRPPTAGAGQDLWEGLIRAREEGLTTDIGVSNYTSEQIEELIDSTGVVPTVNQIEWSPLGWSEEMLGYARDREIVIQAYSPLTRGNRLDDDRLVDFARSYDKTPAQLLLRWDLQLGVAPLPKAGQAEHRQENLQLFDFEITEEDMEKIGDLKERYSALGSLAYA